jgi:hypothetical protein
MRILSSLWDFNALLTSNPNGRYATSYLTCCTDPLESNARGLAVSYIGVISRYLLQRGGGVLGLFPKRSKTPGRAHANIGLFVLEGVDQSGDDLGRILLAKWQETHRNEPLARLACLQIRQQLGRRFFLATAARQQAKQGNQTLPRRHRLRPPTRSAGLSPGSPAIDRFAAGNGTKGLINVGVDAGREEMHRAVAKQEVHSSRMHAVKHIGVGDWAVSVG